MIIYRLLQIAETFIHFLAFKKLSSLFQAFSKMIPVNLSMLYKDKSLSYDQKSTQVAIYH